MVTIVKKGTNDSAFVLSDKSTVLLKAGGVLNIIKDEQYELLMKEYGNFIEKRRLTDKNPLGCFVISDKKSYAKDMSNEIGEIEDKSAPIKVKKSRKAKGE